MNVQLTSYGLRSPFDFYPEQHIYIQLIRRVVEQNRVILMEAGTGFGKTLANLFGALSESNPNPVVYLSRTTNQNSQVIAELKRLLELNPAGSLSGVQLASRRFLCVVPEVLNSFGESQNRLCKVNQKRLEEDASGTSQPWGRCQSVAGKMPPVLTVAGLRKECEYGCPYLTAQELARHRKVVAGAYNYYLDPEIRGRLRLDKPKVLILDEGHNIENILCEMYSKQLTDESVQEAIQEIVECRRAHAPKLKDKMGDGEGSSPSLLRTAEKALRGFLRHLENVVKLSLKKVERGHKTITLNDGREVVLQHKEYAFFSFKLRPYFEGQGIDREYYKDLRSLVSEILESVTAYHLEEVKSKRKLVLATIYEFFTLQTYYFSSSKFAYLVSLTEDSWVLDYKCLTPEVGFRNVRREVSSVVICSGTLTPMHLWKRMIGEKEAVDRLFPSVYNLDNVQVLTLGVDEAGHSLTTQYKYRKESKGKVWEYYRKTLLQLIGRAPLEAGILVFVPSYDILEKLHFPKGIRDSLTGRRVSFYLERRGSEVEEDEDRLTRPTIEAFRDDVRAGLKTVLVGVLGGKFSEGTDFRGNQARMVVVVGVPYPVMDSVTKLKRVYYNTKEKGLGNTWYQAQASQKVSQALGRVCRNSEDWGLGILLDRRWSPNAGRYDQKTQSLLSRWILEVREECSSFTDLSAKMREFYSKRWK